MPWFPLVLKIGHWGSSAPAPLASGGCQSVFLQVRQQLTTPSRYKSPQSQAPREPGALAAGPAQAGGSDVGPDACERR